MSILVQGLTAIGKLIFIAILLFAFLAGMASVVYMSLSGSEVRVPELVGKDYVESEKELAALGLKIKRRADRPSTEKINTVLEQLPKPGETVKTGQMILVVVSKIAVEGEETPKSLIQDIEQDDTEKIEEMISDKPKKPRANVNSNANVDRKKADTTRDVIANSSSTNTSSGNASTPNPDEPRREPATNSSQPMNRNTLVIPIPKPQVPQPSDGDTRPRTAPRP
ncbi:MAG: PASTA domain-containing protein [Blastocatellia bacterium]|nr:PASTA domain-containing protein [Blastocatellia bacterium]